MKKLGLLLDQKKRYGEQSQLLMAKEKMHTEREARKEES